MVRGDQLQLDEESALILPNGRYDMDVFIPLNVSRNMAPRSRRLNPESAEMRELVSLAGS